MKSIDMSTFTYLRGGGTLGSAGGIGTTRSKDAFTLAEMMVVMLIFGCHADIKYHHGSNGTCNDYEK